MESGVYLLKFSGTEKVYIGRSKNIAIRFSQHKSCFIAGSAASKLQEAYNTYGMPDLVILCYAPEDSLECLEKQYIQEYDAVGNGFNTRHSTSGGHSGLWGELNGRSKYSNEQVADVLFLLTGRYVLTYPEISKRTGVRKETIVDIANGTGHIWLAKVFPSEYAKLVQFQGKRKSKAYKKAISPSGEVYEVTHLSNFCREHNLQTGNMSRLLRGQCHSYAGWTAKA